MSFATKWVVIVLFCLLGKREAIAKLAVLVTQPEGCVPVARGNTRTDIEFRCQVEGGVAYWELADHDINNADEFHEFGIIINGTGTRTVLTTNSEALKIFARDEISIRCIAFRYSPFGSVAGKFSYILLYGIPPPPAHLTIIPTDRALQYLLEWSRPEGLQDCVPISYNVTVTNLVTNQTVYLTDESQLVSGGRQQMYVDDSEECQLHEFKVVSWNDAGDSEPEVITETLPISPNIAVVSSSLTAVPVLTDGIQIDITFKPASSCNETRYPVVNYTISISGLNGSIDVPHTGEDIATTLTPDDFPSLQEDTYDVMVMACADFACRSADPVTVGTNHVQYANITFINTTVSLVCVFADTSSAVGCRFQLELSNTTEIVHLERTMNGCVVTQHCTTTQNMREAYLSLTVVAILSNGSVGEFITHPEVFVTDDPADISPCELPASERDEEYSAAIAGIVIGTIVFVILGALAGVFIVFLWRRTRRINMKGDGSISVDGNSLPTSDKRIKIKSDSATPMNMALSSLSGVIRPDSSFSESGAQKPTSSSPAPTLQRSLDCGPVGEISIAKEGKVHMKIWSDALARCKKTGKKEFLLLPLLDDIEIETSKAD